MKPIPNFPGYFATESGEIWSNRSGQLRKLTLQPTRNGYLRATLRQGKQPRPMLVHQLVLMAHVGPKPEGWVTRHLNSVKTDNRLANLCWGTVTENMRDRMLLERRREISAEVQSDLLALAAHVPWTKLAKNYGVTLDRLISFLRDHGITKRIFARRVLATDKLAAIGDLASQGLSHRRIAERVGAHPSTVYKALKSLKPG